AEWCTDDVDSTLLDVKQVVLDDVTIIAANGVGLGTFYADDSLARKAPTHAAPGADDEDRRPTVIEGWPGTRPDPESHGYSRRANGEVPLQRMRRGLPGAHLRAELPRPPLRADAAGGGALRKPGACCATRTNGGARASQIQMAEA